MLALKSLNNSNENLKELLNEVYNLFFFFNFNYDLFTNFHLFIVEIS